MIRRSDSGKEYPAESDISGSLVEQLNLLPRNGKKKKITLVLNNLKFKAMIRCSDSGKEYWVEYPAESDILGLLAEQLEPLPKNGEKAFSLLVRDGGLWIEVPKKVSGV